MSRGRQRGGVCHFSEGLICAFVGSEGVEREGGSERERLREGEES